MNEQSLARQRQIALDYFNERRFSECYEVLERVWRVSGRPDRALDQGIIQIAAACEKALGGNWRGAVSLLETGAWLVEPFRPAWHGIAVDDLHRAAEELLAHLLVLGEGRIASLEPARLPSIHLIPADA